MTEFPSVAAAIACLESSFLSGGEGEFPTPDGAGSPRGEEMSPTEGSWRLTIQSEGVREPVIPPASVSDFREILIQ
jgi:hypothetical protein